MRVTLIYDTFVVKHVHSWEPWCYLSVFCFVVLVAEVVLGVQVRVLGQRGADLLLLLEASGVGDLDVAAFGGGFIYNLLQSGIELAVHVVRWGGAARVLLVSGVTAALGRDLVQNLRFRLLLAGEGQLPPAWISHGTHRGWRPDLVDELLGGDPLRCETAPPCLQTLHLLSVSS